MYLSLTLQQGSIISSLAAMFATHPFAMLFRYTIGVFPISCMKATKHNLKTVNVYGSIKSQIHGLRYNAMWHHTVKIEA